MTKTRIGHRYCNTAYSSKETAIPPERLREHLEEMEQKAVETGMENIARCLASGLTRLRKEENE